jgi:hypothetical protein
MASARRAPFPEISAEEKARLEKEGRTLIKPFVARIFNLEFYGQTVAAADVEQFQALAAKISSKLLLVLFNNAIGSTSSVPSST